MPVSLASTRVGSFFLGVSDAFYAYARDLC